MREMIPLPNQNFVGVCKQINLLIHYYSSSRLVTLPKVIDSPLQITNIFYLIISIKFLNFRFQIILLFFSEISARFKSYIVQIIYIALVWILYLCISNSFFYKTHKHSSSDHGLWCFNLCRPRLFLADVLIFSLVFSQALFMSSLSLKFSKVANLFEISIWYCFLTSSSFSFLRLNLSQ